MGLSYTIESGRSALVFGDINATAFVLTLHEKGVDVERMEAHDESLESYYIRLVGEAK